MRTKIVLVVALALVGVGIYFWTLGNWTERGQAATTERYPPAPANTRGRAERGPFRPGVVPVVVAPVKKSEVPIYLSGIGTVQAYNTIAVKSQVDGVIKNMHFQEGQDVKVGDPLVIIDPEVYEARLQEAQAMKAKAEALLENAKSNLWRDEQLLAKDFVSQRQTDATRALVGQYTAEIAQYEGQIKYAKTQLEYTTIRSPINGRTGIRKVDPGNLIRAADNATIVTIVQLQPIWVIITLPAKEVGRNNITPGLSELPVFAFAENGVTPLDRGQIQLVDNTVDPSTGTIKLKAVFKNERFKLWPGDFVDCKVMVEKRRDGLTVPSAAVRHGPKGDFVWTVSANNTAEPKRVKVRQTLGGTALIDQGLDGDEQVVIDGYYRLQIGSQVEVTKPPQSEGPELSRVR
jgi:multidrug efflux system membrane fusion protein